jgi:hypothetical protein
MAARTAVPLAQQVKVGLLGRQAKVGGLAQQAARELPGQQGQQQAMPGRPAPQAAPGSPPAARGEALWSRERVERPPGGWEDGRARPAARQEPRAQPEPPLRVARARTVAQSASI